MDILVEEMFEDEKLASNIMSVEQFFENLDNSQDNICRIKEYCTELEKSNSSSSELVNALNEKLEKQLRKCQNLEESRSSLRNTIRKASENWLERKAQMSESENEHSADESPKPSFEEKKFTFNQECDIFVELKYKTEQLELSERRAEEITKRLKDYEKVIDDQEIIIHGLKDQLDTYFSDNQKMSKQLAELGRLFQDLEASNSTEVKLPDPPDENKDKKSGKDDQNKDDSNKEELNKEESNKEESNKEESNKEESNKEESNKEETNKEESNKEESNKEESNKEESNKEKYNIEDSNKGKCIKKQSNIAESTKEDCKTEECSSNEDNSSKEENIPSQDEYVAMSRSVSKTYIKLKELIYEKKSLVTEIDRLKILNVELQTRVAQQENRLMSVSDALQSTWLIVSNLKDEHAKIHTAESIIRYELKEKRDILQKLRQELEWAREQWHIIRKINSESETEYSNLRKELDERKAQEEKGCEDSTEECKPTLMPECSFEPPVDLLLDMGIEYGIVDADDEEPTTGCALLEGEDVHAERLRDLENQCGHLYQKLMTSTTRALALASRLTSLHEHYSTEDEDDTDDDEDDENLFEDLYDDQYDLVSPDSESNDTAYVSETDGADTADILNNTGEDSTRLNETESPNGEDSNENMATPPESLDGCDVLSRRLINFLPRKIEILSEENKKLTEKLEAVEEEKNKVEANFKSTIDQEKRQRKKLEDQLSHLGKCVDELKLERNGQIAKAEKDLQKKIEEINKEHNEHKKILGELESLKDMFEQRGELLKLTAGQLEAAENKASKAEVSLKHYQDNLSNLKRETELHKNYSNESPTEDIKRLISTMECSSVHADLNSYAPANLNSLSSSLSQIFQAKSQFLILAPNSTLIVPFTLSPGVVLIWNISAISKEILTEVLYASSNTEDSPDVIHLQETLTIIPSVLPVIGKLLPKVSGQFSICLKNISNRSEKIQFRIWTDSENSDACNSTV